MVLLSLLKIILTLCGADKAQPTNEKIQVAFTNLRHNCDAVVEEQDTCGSLAVNPTLWIGIIEVVR